MSEPKRPVLESSLSVQAPNTPAATSLTPMGSAADLFVGRSEADRVSHAVQEEPQSRKRKEMEAEIQIDELESIMSEDMDCFDEQSITHSFAEQKQSLNTAESSSKRQRVHLEEKGSNKRTQLGLERESGTHKGHSQKSEHHIVSVKTEQVHPFEYRTAYHESSKPPEASSASTSKNIDAFEDDEASFIEVRILLSVCQWSSVHSLI